MLVSGTQQIGIAGATLLAGQAVYKDANGKLQLALNDTAAHANITGITLSGASLNQPVVYATPGSTITIGATVAAGTVYVVSATAGKIAVDSDLTTGLYITQIGRGISTTAILFEGTVYTFTHA